MSFAQAELDQIDLDALSKEASSISLKKFDYSAKNGYLMGYDPNSLKQTKQLSREAVDFSQKKNTELFLDNFFGVLIQTSSLWTYAYYYPKTFIVSPAFFTESNPQRNVKLTGELFSRDKDRIIFASREKASDPYYLCVCDIYTQKYVSGKFDTRIQCFTSQKPSDIDATLLKAKCQSILDHFFQSDRSNQHVEFLSIEPEIKQIVKKQDFHWERYHAQLAWLAQFATVNSYCVEETLIDQFPTEKTLQTCKKMLLLGMSVFVDPQDRTLQTYTPTPSGQLTNERLIFAAQAKMKKSFQTNAIIETPYDDDDMDSTMSAEIEQFVQTL
jgi:hypothetical protein